jgi:hydroxyacylglutathione hydrolase
MSETSDLYFAQLPVGEMANLAYLIGSRAERKAFVVDPAWNVGGLLAQAARDDVEIVGALLELQPVPIHANKHEVEGLIKVTGVSENELVAHESGDLLKIGGVGIRLIHTPGHTPGSQCFLVEESKQSGHLVAGDTLFLNGCGRVDLPGSDPRAMYESLETLKRLPDDTILYPGHLYSPEGHDVMGEQKRTNPYLRAASVEVFLSFMGH